LAISLPDHNNYLLTAVLAALIVRLLHIPTLTQRKALGTGKAQLNQAGNMTAAAMTTKTRVTRTDGAGDITIIITVNTHRTRYIPTMIGTVIALVRNRHGLLMESQAPEFPRP